MTSQHRSFQPQDVKLVIVIGQAGAGHSTALHVLEDSGFSPVDNMPLALVDQLVALEVETTQKRLAIGVDVRTTGFDVEAVKRLITNLKSRFEQAAQVLFVCADEAELLRRYQATRRRHPLVQEARLSSQSTDNIERETGLTVAEAVRLDQQQMEPLRLLADLEMNTSQTSPTEFRELLLSRLGLPVYRDLSVTLTSFSYRHGVPATSDYVFDMRFLENPHWDKALRAQDGRSDAVYAFVTSDPAFQPFMQSMADMMDICRARFVEEGRPALNISFGCTGGRHRSVSAARWMAEYFGQKGQIYQLLHRELD